MLGRVRFRHDSFLVERNGQVIAQITPVVGSSPTTAESVFRAWLEAAPHDPTFADDLELVGSLDTPPDDPGAS